MIYFPKIKDLKHITSKLKYMKGGLEKMASILDVSQIGAKHQAGSDSLVTMKVFNVL